MRRYTLDVAEKIVVEPRLGKDGTLQVEIHNSYSREHNCSVAWLDRQEAIFLIQHPQKVFNIP